MGLFEKRRCAKFLNFANQWDIKDTSTWKKHDLKNITFADLIKEFGLEDNTCDFIGHAVALHTNDKFLKKSALETMEKIKLYIDSYGRFGDSPFIYPIYGLAGIPEGFSRKCAVHGGTYMLKQNIDTFLLGDDGKVTGVKDGEKQANAPKVIANPKYYNFIQFLDILLDVVCKIN